MSRLPVEGLLLLGSRRMSVAAALPAVDLRDAREVLQCVAAVEAPVEAAVRPAQGGVDDHLAVGQRRGVDHDLVGRVADEGVVAERRVDRQRVARRRRR